MVSLNQFWRLSWKRCHTKTTFMEFYFRLFVSQSTYLNILKWTACQDTVYIYVQCKAAATLEPELTQTTVWPDSRQGNTNHPHYCSCHRLHWNRSDWNVVSQNGRLSGPKKWVLLRADGVARHLLQLAYDSNVAAMDKTYLIEIVRDIPPLLGRRDKK